MPAPDITPEQAKRILSHPAQHLEIPRVDSTLSAVCLLSGLTPDEVNEVGGLNES